MDNINNSAAQDSSAQTPEVAQAAPVAETVSSQPKVVLIEDDGLILRMYEKKLVLDGYQLFTATNGKDGLDLIAKEKPSLILCDVMMPQMNGFEVLKAAKANPETANIPFIMLTNLSDQAEAEKAIEAGAVTYLIKSNIVPADVIAKVKEVLKASGATAIPQGVAVNAA